MFNFTEREPALAFVALIVLAVLAACWGGASKVAERAAAGGTAGELHGPPAWASGRPPTSAAGDAAAGAPRLGREEARRDLAATADGLGWAGGIFAVAAGLGLAASFIPVLSSLIPRGLAVGLGAASGACLLARYAVRVYGVALSEALFWVAVAAVLAFVGPVAWNRYRTLVRPAAKLAGEGKAAEATALRAAAVGASGESRRARARRKRLLAQTAAQGAPGRASR